MIFDPIAVTPDQLRRLVVRMRTMGASNLNIVGAIWVLCGDLRDAKAFVENTGPTGQCLCQCYACNTCFPEGSLGLSRVERARLDADRTAKPKTKLVAQVNPKHCVPHGGIGAMATHYEGDDGERTKL